MTRNILLLLLMASLSLGACRTDEKKTRELAKADWLQGNWINESPDGNLTESWQKKNDSLYHGQSFYIKGKDTIHFESIVLSERKGIVVYSPTVQGQNNDAPVDFKMTSATENQLIFENPGHDYPQKIKYTKITKDSLIAEISGNQLGKPSTERFAMHRRK